MIQCGARPQVVSVDPRVGRLIESFLGERPTVRPPTRGGVDEGKRVGVFHELGAAR